MEIIKTPIFDYFDYRSYLSDFYNKNKLLVDGFSFRSVARIAKLRSANYLKLIIDGHRRLTLPVAQQLAPVLKLSEKEQQYLSLMIDLTNSGDGRVREKITRDMLELRTAPTTHRLSQEQWRIGEKWYYIVILQLANLPQSRADGEWLAARLGISKREAQAALNRLVKWNLLEVKKNRLIRLHSNNLTEDEVERAYIKLFHQEALANAARRLFEQEIDEREYQSLTFCLHRSQIPALKRRIKRFREELLKLTNQPAPSPEHVYQFNMNLFRVSQP